MEVVVLWSSTNKCFLIGEQVIRGGNLVSGVDGSHVGSPRIGGHFAADPLARWNIMPI